MNPNKKIILYFVITIFLFNSFSGCIFDDLFSDNKGTTFSMNRWNIVDDNGFPGLYLNFSCSDRITVEFLDPNNVLVDSDYFLGGAQETTLHLSSYGEMVTPGSYILEVHDKDSKRIYKNSFSFDDSDIIILSCGQKWWKQDSDNDDYTLVGLSMKIENSGDTPVYPYTLDLIVDSFFNSGVIIPAIILPGQTQQVNCVIYKQGVPNENTFNVILKDRYDNVIATGSFSVNTSDIVDVKTFNWKHNNFDWHLEIPEIDFLFDYYSNLDRPQSQDYGLYVFDPHDDPYIDLLVDSLMSDFNSDNDVDKINYAASFVQARDYIEDSLTDKSYEYPRYPVETLFNGNNGGGDCEDLAILTAAILDNMGYNIALIRLPDHMAVGVSLGVNQVPDYEYFTNSYYYLEATNKNSPVGFIPSEYRSSIDIDVFPISSRALLIHHWVGNSLTIYTNTDSGDFVKVTVLMENLGRTTATNVKVEGAFYTNSVKYNTKSDTISILEPFTKKEITLTVTIPKPMKTLFKTRLYLNGEMVDERESSSTFPV